MSIWLLIILAALVVAIVSFLKTHPEQRYKFSSTGTLEDKIKNYPQKAQAVIIRGNLKQALVRLVPVIIIGLVLVTFTLWSKGQENIQCIRLLDVNAAYIWLLLMCYGFPLGLLIWSLSIITMGIKVIREGYFPPLDSITFTDTIATKGASSVSRGILILVIPFFALYIVYVGHNAYSAIVDSKSEMTEYLEADCL